MTNVDTNTLPMKGQILFCKKHSDSTIMFSETDIINMLDFLIENMFAMLGGRVFQQTLGIPMGTNFAPLLSDFIRMKNEKKLAQSFNFTFRYMDDVLLLNNFVYRIYPIKLEKNGYHKYRYVCFIP
jgi:hypothetical protein